MLKHFDEYTQGAYQWLSFPNTSANSYGPLNAWTVMLFDLDCSLLVMDEIYEGSLTKADHLQLACYCLLRSQRFIVA